MEGLGCPLEGVPSPGQGARPDHGSKWPVAPLPLPSPHLKTCLGDVLGGVPPPPVLWLMFIHFPPHKDTCLGQRLGIQGKRAPEPQAASLSSFLCTDPRMCTHGPFPLLVLSQKWPHASPLEGCRPALPGLWLPVLVAVLTLHGGTSVVTSPEGDCLLA